MRDVHARTSVVNLVLYTNRLLEASYWILTG